MKPRRLKMVLDLSQATETALPPSTRTISESDVDALVDLMLESYRGTIDYSGETLEESIEEARGTLSGKYGKLISEASFMTKDAGLATSAVIFTFFEKDQMPLLTFSMTRASYKGQGLGKNLLKCGLFKLKQLGFTSCCLYVTEGNKPAISIYRSLGFAEHRGDL